MLPLPPKGSLDGRPQRHIKDAQHVSTCPCGLTFSRRADADALILAAGAATARILELKQHVPIQLVGVSAIRRADR